MEKSAVSCPDFSKSRSYSVKSKPKVSKNRRTGSRLAMNNKVNFEFRSETGTSKQPDMNLIISNFQQVISETKENPKSEIEWKGRLSIAREFEYTDFELNTNNHPKDLLQVVCDTLVFKSGDIMFCDVAEVGQEVVKIRNCGDAGGRIITLLKTELSVIKYANGNRDFFTVVNDVQTTEQSVISQNKANYYTPAPPVRKTEGMSLASFFTSIGGFFIAGIPLGITSLVLGTMGYNKINRQPDKYAGRGLAIFGIIMGFIDVVGAIIVISSIL